MIGSMVWDTIYGRDAAAPAVEEWGGIAYALAALDATLDEDWLIVPLVKVGRDLAPQANAFLRSLRHRAPDARFIEVAAPNNRVTLRYASMDRRCEQMQGGVPPWTWPELGPLVQDLDALYVNFISGFEMTLDSARLMRQGFPRFIYADLHSLFLGKATDGSRFPQPLLDAAAWFGCFDVIQLNESEMAQLGDDSLAVAAAALGSGCRALCVTLAGRGVAYFERQGGAAGSGAGPIRAARIAPQASAALTEGDPTGCGDVFGAAAAAALLEGAGLEDALREATRLAGRNVSFRGATGLRDHLLGRLATP